MPRMLRNLRIDDVSSVDVGAGRGVRVVLTKRDRDALKKHRDGVPLLYGKPLEFGGDLDDETGEYLKREVSQDERDRLAGEGKALPDGSFPIANVGDLKNAIQAIGRAKNPAKAKAHIRARAKALGQENLIPDSWSKRLITKAEFLELIREIAERNALASLVKSAHDFDDAAESYEIADDASDLMCCLQKAMCALDCSIQSILGDDEVVDKRAAISSSFEQFKRYLAGMALGQDDDDDEDTQKRDEPMTTAVSPAVQKIIDEAVAKALADVTKANDVAVTKLKDELVVAKMSVKHRQYHDSMSDDMEKGKFKNMSEDERDAYMDKMSKRAEDDPIVKTLRAENQALMKRLEALETKDALEIAKRDAREMGLAQADAGEILMKSRRGDKDAHTELEKRMVTLAKSGKAMERMSKAFDELGHNQRTADGQSASAMDEFNAQATELRKKEPALSPAQAFAKVYNDPANLDLRKREQDERFSKMGGAAA